MLETYLALLILITQNKVVICVVVDLHCRESFSNGNALIKQDVTKAKDRGLITGHVDET
jgi:hypothetical protein